MTFTVAQRQRAIGLYKRLLRTSRKTFDGDVVAIGAARDETRRRFKEAAQETDAAKIDEGLKMGDEIVSVLRQNVVQGKWRQERDAYELRMTKDTELGNNDSIKEARAKQIADLKAGKKPERKSCREMAAQYQAASSSSSVATASSSASNTVRAFSTSTRPASTILAQATHFHSQQRSGFVSSASASSRDPSAVAQAPLPRPVPKFSSTTILADGSSIQLATTSPRRLTRLTRDPTNHPLWNPGQERKIGGDAGDDSGRLGRFRRRFEGVDGAVPEAKVDAGDVSFGQEDLDWMSVGGREARAGSPIAAKKAAKGKGRK
ncbi:related to MZM1-protein required for assembly of the cytochrome bc1 complex [Sporisorium reilianum f. sp. reilianum]|uniref:Mitochondrial zinc maintenance protein 1, mitochondrial n=1 Tax=Sporisorium reilianum f. sp. reilianum TaxID=72559 RepID=A0A2N8U7H6_9BASI|nr:related to MZM1-protein required for assembly of the cytochrome bc1 complex [Sporisorium reilianum f. sp. reilianum]